MSDGGFDSYFGPVKEALTIIRMLLGTVIKEPPKPPPPPIAIILDKIPTDILQAANELAAEIDRLEQECRRAGIDLKRSPSQLRAEGRYWLLSRRRRVMAKFDGRVAATRAHLERLLEDVAAALTFNGQEEIIDRSLREALETDAALRRETSDDVPIEAMLRSLRRRIEQAKADAKRLRGTRKR